MPPIAAPIDRRNAIKIAGAACLTGLATTGCDSEPTSAPLQKSDARTDIPIRVVMVCSDDVAETTARGWSSVSEQAIAIQAVSFDRTRPSEAIGALVAASAKSDVLVGPSSSIAELYSEKAIVPLADDGLTAISDDLYPALRNGMARYAADLIAMPIATPLPALWMTANEASPNDIKTWVDYDRFVGTVWKGKAAEPTAAGWAATSFLWRASTSVSRWLFSRETFAPAIDDEEHVACLSQMAKTVNRYTTPRQTMAEVYGSIRQGNVSGGVAYPTDGDPMDADWNVSSLPASESLLDSLVKPLPDLFSPVAMLSANCRQTEASKTFIGWLTGGEGSQSSRQKLPPMYSTRESIQDNAITPYATWITKPLRAALALPTMQIIAAGEYYRVLDDAVQRCLDGKDPAEQALKNAAQQWNQITARIGTDEQLRAWRRAQGMRA